MKRVMFLGLLVACGTSKSADSESSKTDGPAGITNQELLATPLTQVAAKAGAVAFTIELPASQLKPAEIKDAYATWDPKKAWADSPSFTVLSYSTPPMDTGDTMPLGDDAAQRVIARAEVLPDGGYLNLDQRIDHAFYRLEVCRPAAGGKLCCSVTQRDKKPLDAFAEIVAMAEKVCLSMKPAS